MLSKHRSSIRKTFSDNRAQIGKRESKVLDYEGWKSLPALTGKETDQDLIDRFNAYYILHKQELDEDANSVSTIVDTESQLLKSRECRRVLMRKLLVTICVCLWAISVGNCFIWFDSFFVWPMHFARWMTEEIKSSDEGSISGKYGILGFLFLQPYLVGTWGVISAFCGRNRCLKRFMLTVPWSLIISSVYSFMAVKFVGSLSQEKIRNEMQKRIGMYYIDAFSKDAWDAAHSYLKCCGIDDLQDWILSNERLTERLPPSCCRTIHDRRETDSKQLKICMLGLDPNMAWKEGCSEKLFEFYINYGALITAMGFSVSLLSVMAVIFARKYYILIKKETDTRFRYSWGDFALDFFFVKWLYALIKKRSDKKAGEKKGASGEEGKDKEPEDKNGNMNDKKRGSSSDNHATSILFKSSLVKTPSENKFANESVISSASAKK